MAKADDDTKYTGYFFHLALFLSALVLEIQLPCHEEALDIRGGHLQAFCMIIPTEVLTGSHH